MISIILLILLIALFALATVRIKQAKARAAVWKRVAIGSAVVTLFLLFRRKGAANA